MDPITAGILGGGSLISGILGANAAKDAASTQANAAILAAQTSANMQNKMLGRTLAMQRPYMRLGNQALNTLAILQGLKPTAPTSFGYSRMPDYGWMKRDPLYALAKDIPTGTEGATIAPGREGLVINTSPAGEKGLTADEVMQAIPGLNRKQAEEAVGLYEKYGDRALAGLVRFGEVGAGEKLGGRFEREGSFAIAKERVPTRYDAAAGIGDPGAGSDAFFMSPEYQAQYKLGLEAMKRQNAATGEGLSGRQLAAAQQFGQKIGSSAYTDWYNRLAGIANLGPQSAGNMASNLQTAGAGMAGDIGAGIGAAGTAGAAGQLGASNAWANALNQGLGVFGAYQQGKQDDAFQNQLLSLLQGGGGGGFGGGYPMGGWGGGGASIGGMTAGDFAYQPNFVTQ